MSFAAETSWSSAALAFGLSIAVRASVLLLAGLLAAMVFGSRRAAVRASIGHACVLGLLLLPCAAWLIDPLEIACLPAGLGSVGKAVQPGDVRPPSAGGPFDPAESSRIPEPIVTSSDRPGEPVLGASDRLAVVSQATAKAPAPALAGSPGFLLRLSWPAAVVVSYASVVGVLLLRLIASIAAAARLRKTGQPVDDRDWTAALDNGRRRLGIGRAVGLVWSTEVSVPAVLGSMRPVILLPAKLSERHAIVHAEAILLHELSHVRRGDYPWNIALRVVQALYWPHPLVWLLGRVIAALREQVCDDVCVHELGDPALYGATLLAVAAGIPPRPALALGLAMARPSRLGGRLARIARSRGEARCLAGWRARAAIVATMIAAPAVAGAGRLTRAETPSGSQASAQQASPTPAGATPVQQPASGGRVLHLQFVSAQTGKPVPNADVRVSIGFSDYWRKADEQGRLEVVHSTGPGDRRVSVDVWGDGFAMQRHQWGNSPNTPVPDGETIRLQPGESLGGVVQDENGQPIRGAVVYLWSHNYKRKDPHELLFDLRAITGPDGRWHTGGAPETTGELMGRNGEVLGVRVVHPDYLSSRSYGDKDLIPTIADLRAGKSVIVMKKGVPIEGRVVDAGGRPVAGATVLSADNMMEIDAEDFAVPTDENGHFRTGQVKAGDWYLIARVKGHAPGETHVRIARAVPQVEIRLGRAHILKGRVVDPAGKAIAGAFINFDTWRGYRFLRAFFCTDADGRFQWDEAPDGELTIQVNEGRRRGERGPFARLVREFSVSPIPGVRRLDPLDIGTLRLTARHAPKPGDPAPNFVVTTVDGKVIRLEDYPGKFLLLDFGVLWEDQSRLQIARLNDVHQGFGEDERFAMLSLVMAADDAKSRAFIAEKGEPWPQTIVGPLTNELSIAYGTEDAVPAAILIGPDGKIVARDLHYQAIGEAVAHALHPAAS